MDAAEMAPWRLRVRWLWRRRTLAVGALLVILVVLAALLAPLLARTPPDAQDLACYCD